MWTFSPYSNIKRSNGAVTSESAIFYETVHELRRVPPDVVEPREHDEASASNVRERRTVIPARRPANGSSKLASGLPLNVCSGTKQPEHITGGTVPISMT